MTDPKPTAGHVHRVRVPLIPSFDERGEQRAVVGGCDDPDCELPGLRAEVERLRAFRVAVLSWLGEDFKDDLKRARKPPKGWVPEYATVVRLGAALARKGD